MEETIIIYTRYYSEAVMEIIDNFDLQIQIMCFSSYEDVLNHVQNGANIRGIIFIEHKPSTQIKKAYKLILEIADDISGASKQPFCVSIISNNDTPRKVVQDIRTENLDIYFTKFTLFNTDMLRFEGIATVILNTIGVAKDSILLELERRNNLGTLTNSSSNKQEFLKLCLDITTAEKEDLYKFHDAVERYPQLSKLVYLKTNKDMDDEILAETDNLFKVFAKHCIANRRG